MLSMEFVLKACLSKNKKIKGYTPKHALKGI